MDDKKYTPILPFDSTKEDNFNIYDSVTYTRDVSMLEPDFLKMHYPNMIKYFRCEDNPPQEVGGD